MILGALRLGDVLVGTVGLERSKTYCSIESSPGAWRTRGRRDHLAILIVLLVRAVGYRGTFGVCVGHWRVLIWRGIFARVGLRPVVDLFEPYSARRMRGSQMNELVEPPLMNQMRKEEI